MNGLSLCSISIPEQCVFPIRHYVPINIWCVISTYLEAHHCDHCVVNGGDHQHTMWQDKLCPKGFRCLVCILGRRKEPLLASRLRRSPLGIDGNILHLTSHSPYIGISLYENSINMSWRRAICALDYRLRCVFAKYRCYCCKVTLTTLIVRLQGCAARCGWVLDAEMSRFCVKRISISFRVYDAASKVFLHNFKGSKILDLFGF